MMRVLYIDDDADDCDLVKEAIAEIDPSIEVLAFTDPLNALTFLERSNPLPDYIFLDINMPRMSGGECLMRIKQQQRLSGIPVVMCSTSFRTSEMKQYFHFGAYDFIVKPPSMNKLVEAFSSILFSPMKTANRG